MLQSIPVYPPPGSRSDHPIISIDYVKKFIQIISHVLPVLIPLCHPVNHATTATNPSPAKFLLLNMGMESTYRCLLLPGWWNR